MSIKDYIKLKESILKDMKIWKKLDGEQKAKFKSCATKFEVDCLMTTFIERYL